MDINSTQTSSGMKENIAPTRNTENEIYFNFSYSALKLLGKNLYSNPTNAISELVANALDANASNVYVYIDMSDKAHSIIEIIDDGSGMSYSDLAKKYVWVGRNKRDDLELNSEDKQSIMGRKGIGKLAALYLSNRYYILTRKDSSDITNQWEVNLTAYADSDYPKLDRVSQPIQLVNNKIWNNIQHGTAIILENVDLRRNGDKKIEGLRRVFADFYLLDAIKSKIYIAVKTDIDEKIVFEPIEKKIAYKNFYALFDNSELNIASNMLDSVAFTWASDYPHISNKQRETKRIDPTDFKTKGKGYFQKEDGSYTEKEYELSGWIAIHCTIESKDAVDKNFLRNSVYQPNRLRLYVRNKLAVADYFSIRPNTQAMANYIEGEISFNILDDDDLPDIATSSRQDFLDDERVELLISLVDPIISHLFALRNAIGRSISEENKEYREELLREEEEKRQNAEKARKKAEEEARVAEQAKIDAEIKYETAQSEAMKYRAQSNIIFNTITEDQKNFSAKTHLVKTNALTIRNGVTTLAKKIGIQNYKELGAIAVATDKILSALKYSALAKFNIEDEFIVEDLFMFIHEYLLNVLGKQYFDININTNIQGEYKIRFNPQYISLLLDNMLANSKKSHSTDFTVEMMYSESIKSIVICDNGDGFGTIDKQQIFEFGYSNTGGTGIGLYNVKTVVDKMHGEIFADDNFPTGAKFIISLP